VSTNLSIQESLYPELTCFGCGHANPHGFHLRSYREGDLTGRPVPFLTASFEVTFHRPTPLGPSVQLNASPESVDPSHIIVKSEMSVDDKVRATMTASWAPIRSR
jgi:acyl-coenzyme A thioesterase PaaI-like protein